MIFPVYTSNSACDVVFSIQTSLPKGFPLEGLLFVGAKSVETPDSFNIHPHLKKTHVEARLKKLKNGNGIDWATAEALAIGSLLYQG